MRAVHGVFQWLKNHPARAAALAGWYQQVAGGIVFLAIIPTVNSRLSISEAALWFSFQSLTAVVLLTDFGIGFAVARQVAYSLATETKRATGDFIATQPGWSGVGEVLSAARQIYVALVVVAASLLVILHLVLVATRDIVREQMLTSSMAWYLLGAVAVLSLYVKQYTALVEGTGGMHLSRFITGTYQFFAGAAALSALVLTENIAVMSAAVFVTTGVYFIIIRKVFWRRVPENVLFNAGADRRIVSSLWRAAYPVGIIGVSGYFVAAVQVPLIGLVFDPARVSSFYAAQKIGQMLNAAVAQISAPQMPLFTRELSSGDAFSALLRARKVVGFVWVLTVLVNAVFFLLSPSFADAWLGAGKFVSTATLFVLAVDYALTGGCVVLGQFVLASGKNPFMWSTLAMGGLNLTGCVVLGRELGVLGIALSGLISGLLTNYWLLPTAGLIMLADLKKRVLP